MKKSAVILLPGLMACGGHAQGTFQNLNFESTTLPYSSNTVGGVSASDAFPGWTVQYGNNVQPLVAYNAVASQSAISLWSRDFAGVPAIPASFGNFSALIQASSLDPVFVSLSQSSLIPSGVDTLLFETFRLSPSLAANNLQITFGGNILPLQANPTGNPLHLLWQADISSYAGQMGELQFSAIAQDGNTASFRLDNLQFTAIPEPSTWALLGLGGGLLAWAVRRRKS